MNIIMWILLLILILITAVFSIYFNRIPKNTMSFRESMDLTSVPVVTFLMNNNIKFNFLFDTGSDTSYLSVSSFELIKDSLTKVNAKTSVTGLGGIEDAVLYKTEFSYKGKKYEDIFGVLEGLDASFSNIKRASGVSINGILGSKFFEKYKYVLDFKNLIAYTK